MPLREMWLSLKQVPEHEAFYECRRSSLESGDFRRHIKTSFQEPISHLHIIVIS